MSPVKRGQTILNIQILRFIAAAMVLFGHVQHELHPGGAAHSVGFIGFDPVYWAGGVDIFFVISGFIMYLLANESFGKPGAASDFLMRRLVRIAPPYWFFTVLFLAASLTLSSQIQHTEMSAANVIASFFFIPVASPYGDMFPVLRAGWTLNFEMLFYVVMTVGLCFRRVLGLGVIIGVIGLLALVGIVSRPTSGPFAFWCDPIVLEFLLGLLIAHLWVKNVRWSKTVGLAVFVSAIGLMLAAKATGVAGNYWTWRFLWMGIPAALICASLAFIPENGPRSDVSKLLGHGGDASFALYLSHPFAIGVVALILGRVGLNSPIIFIITACVASLIAASVIHLVLEKPVTRFLGKQVSRWQMRRAAQGPQT